MEDIAGKILSKCLGKPIKDKHSRQNKYFKECEGCGKRISDKYELCNTCFKKLDEGLHKQTFIKKIRGKTK